MCKYRNFYIKVYMIWLVSMKLLEEYIYYICLAEWSQILALVSVLIVLIFIKATSPQKVPDDSYFCYCICTGFSTFKKLYLFIYFTLPHRMACRILVPLSEGWTLAPPQWKDKVLTTGLPRNSWIFNFSIKWQELY